MKPGTLVRMKDKSYIWELNRGRLYWVAGMSRERPGHLACESIYPDTLFKYAYPHPTHVEEITNVKDMTKEEIVQVLSQMRARLATLDNALETRTQKSHQQARKIEELTVRIAILEEVSDAKRGGTG